MSQTFSNPIIEQSARSIAARLEVCGTHTLRLAIDEIDALRSRVKGLESEKEIWGNEFNAVIIMKEESARLTAALISSNQIQQLLVKVVARARKHRSGQGLPSQCVSLNELIEIGKQLDEALLELDRAMK